MPRSISHSIKIVAINDCFLNVTCLGTNEACRGGREPKARAVDIRASDLCLHPGVLYECPRIRCEAAHSHADVCVHLCNLLNAGWLLSTRGTQFISRAVTTRFLNIHSWKLMEHRIFPQMVKVCFITVCRYRYNHHGAACSCQSNEHTSNGDVTRFSTTRTTPSFDRTPMAVVPSCTVR